MKKAISMITAWLIMAACLPVSAGSESTPAFSLASQTGTNGAITVTVGFSGSVENVGGLRLAIQFNQEELSYVEGSRQVLSPSLLESELNTDKASGNAVFLSWSAAGKSLTTGQLASFQFRPVEGYTGSASALQYQIHDFYRYDSALTDISVASATGSVSASTPTSAISGVESLINAIGTVEYTTTSYNKIVAARNAYNALTVVQKRAVTNLDTLTAAEYRYSQLREESESNASAAEAAGFRSSYAGLLAKTVATLTLEDETQLTAALDAYALLSVKARIALIDEKNVLNKLKTRLTELKKIEEAEAAEQQLIEEARTLAAEFRSVHASLLALTVDKIQLGHEQGILSALADIQGYTMMNTYVEQELANEIALLNAMQARIEELEAEQGNGETVDTAQKQAASFMRNFGYLLTIDASEILASDMADIQTAMAYFDLLDADAQALVGNSVTSKLSALLSVAKELAAAGDSDAEETPGGSSTKTIIKERIVYRDRDSSDETVSEDVEDNDSAEEEDSGGVLVNVKSKGISGVVWVLMLSAASMMTLCAAAGGTLFVFRRKLRYV